MIFEFEPLANLRPVFFAYILIDFYGPIALIKPVRPNASWPRNPILLAGFHAKVVCLKSAALQALKRLVAGVKCRTGSAERHSANPSGTVKPTAHALGTISVRIDKSATLALDIHNSGRISLLGHSSFSASTGSRPTPCRRVDLFARDDLCRAPERAIGELGIPAAQLDAADDLVLEQPLAPGRGRFFVCKNEFMEARRAVKRSFAPGCAASVLAA